MSAFFQMDAAQQSVVSELDCRLLPASERLLLAQKYNHKPWISNAFRELLWKHYILPTLKDYVSLGMANIFYIHETKIKIHNHHQLVVFSAPRVNHSIIDCTGIVKCEEVWKMAWWSGFGHHYMHPDFPATPEEAYSLLDDAEIPHMAPRCKKRTVEDIRKSKVLEEEYRIIERTIKII
ncbi:hypothetical protein K439DRAFT_1618758 [Ramaria rubella]|nr:hypothetical protein K439DRAFT_1618758 [Ramaria rubella]